MTKLAQIGTINAPPGVNEYGNFISGGLTSFIANIISFLLVIAGLYAFINLILAGYAFITAGDDPKKVESAWAKITQTLLGLALAAAAFLITGIISYIFYGNFLYFQRITIFGPR